MEGKAMSAGTKFPGTNNKQQRDQRQDALTLAVRGIVEQEKAAQDAKTAKLRALRIARDASAPAATEEKAPVKRSKRSPKQ